MSRYALVTLVAQAISFAVFRLACAAAPHVWPQVFVVTGAAIATLFSYTGQRFFTFAPPRLASHGASRLRRRSSTSWSSARARRA